MQQVCKYRATLSLIFTGFRRLDDNLHQAGKMHNLHQICGVSGYVGDLILLSLAILLRHANVQYLFVILTWWL